MIESAARRLAHELVNRREAINRELSRNGVRFGTGGCGIGTGDGTFFTI